MTEADDIPAPVRCTDIAHGGAHDDAVELEYEGRFLRRKRLTTRAGRSVLVDLPEARSLRAGDVLLGKGLRVAVLAASEPLLEIRGDLARLAWHIGNRHTPCEIGAGTLRIRDDHVLRGMLERLGADLAEVTAPFEPEGGAYGHGRTFGHDHGPGVGQGLDHDHGPGQDDRHDHAHDPGQAHAP